jgi:hypothetical protein
MPHKDPEIRKAYLAEYNKRWYEANKEKRKAQVRQYKAMNPAKVAKANAEYQARPEVRQRATLSKQLWRETNRDSDRLTRRVWTKNNRDKVRDYDRRYRSDRSVYNASWYAANRDYCRERDALRYIQRRDGVSDDQYQLMAALAGLTG